MAKNISVNQWFTDIHDDVYLNTAVINNILFVAVVNNSSKSIPANTILAKLRYPDLMQQGQHATYTSSIDLGLGTKSGNLQNFKELSTNTMFGVFTIRNKQLETDFFTPEQLAEMHPNDPAYQASDEPTTQPDLNATKPVVDPVEEKELT